ncbi:MAG: hypothetical protein AB1351_05670 [Thermoproteota archaeon]
MSRKAKVKSRSAVKLKGKLPARKATKRKPKTHKVRTTIRSKSSGKKIVRIMGQGQFAVDARTLKKLSDIDTEIVELVRAERSDDFEFKKKLTELNDTVMKNGRPVDSREIIKSDIILPSADLSIDEAKRLFMGEGVIPEI